ncbi:MAG: hypothetical protein J6T15_04745 [Bacilli bacterium]|nr:hypothetical protein [Bacilli bacterium]
MTKVKKAYRLTYQDENRFKGLFNTLRKYNMLAYKQFVFNYLPELRKGNLVGSKVNDTTYRLPLSSDNLFEFVYGATFIEYTVNDNIITITDIEPQRFLFEGRRRALESYKGCPYISTKERFLIDFYYQTHREE